MNAFWITTVIILFLSASFLGLCLVSLYRYGRRFSLKEDSYTMLFRFIRMEHIVLTYIAFTAAHIIGTLLFITYLASA